jgi:RHS repeat-associated protein
LLETDGNDFTQVVYTSGLAHFGDLCSQARGSVTSYYVFNGIGSAVQLVDASGTSVTDTYIYQAFGILQLATGSTTNPFRFVGKLGYYLDTDTGLYYLRARSYVPSLGRFISPDRFLSHPGGIYCYVQNSPTGLVDPSGLTTCAQECCCCVDDLKIDLIKKIPQEYNPMPPYPEGVFGHVFRVLTKLSLYPIEKGSFCKLEWFEKSNLVPKSYKNCKPDEWCEVYSLDTGSSVFVDWDKAKKITECPKVLGPFSLVDAPAMAKDLKSSYRCFKIVITSSCPKDSKKCADESKTLYALQILEANDKGEITTQDFKVLEKECDYPKKK